MRDGTREEQKRGIYVAQALVPLLVEPDEATLVGCWEALGMVTASIPKDLLPSYVPVLKEAIATAREKVGLTCL